MKKCINSQKISPTIPNLHKFISRAARKFQDRANIFASNSHHIPWLVGKFSQIDSGDTEQIKISEKQATGLKTFNLI